MEKASNKKNGPAPKGSGDSVRTHEHNDSISRIRTTVKHKQLKVTFGEAVMIGKRIAPGFDKFLLSKCLNPAKYGIKPVEGIASKIFSESRVSGFRSLPNQFTVRCDDALKSRLQQAKNAFGEDCTNQEFILTAILHECERIEGKRKEAEYGFTL